MVEAVLLASDGQAVFQPQRLFGIVLQMHRAEALYRAHGQHDLLLGWVRQLLGGLNGVFQRVAEQCVQVSRFHVGKALAIRHAGKADLFAAADLVFLG